MTLKNGGRYTVRTHKFIMLNGFFFILRIEPIDFMKNYFGKKILKSLDHKEK